MKLADVAPMLKARAIPPSETQALEVATAFLFIESALDNYFKLGTDFERQAKTVSDRLKAAMAGEAVPPMDTVEGGILDEMTRRAQEKLLVFQVGQEVQVNLQGIEQALDGFFRDPAKRDDLKGLPAQFAQVQGALMIMELDAAAGLNAAVTARVQQFAEGTLDGKGEAAEMVADGLSALGLYITAIQQGAARPEEVLQPALVRFGLAPSAEKAAEEALRKTGTVSPLDLDVRKQKVQALYEDWKETPGAEVKEKLERAVDDLKRDAVVIADSEVARQSDEALAALHGAVDASQTGVFRAIEELAPENPPESPTPQVVQLVDAPGAEIDRELLEIFLEEATEVAATIAQHLATCRDAPHDRESLTTIRRGFHTLKGSGRMVGLTDLGEVAWQCEQVMNKWLKEEKPATPDLLDFIALAERSFSGWIDQLKAGAETAIDGAEIAGRAEMLKSGEAVAPAPPIERLPEEAPPAEELAPAAAEIAGESQPRRPRRGSPSSRSSSSPSRRRHRRRRRPSRSTSGPSSRRLRPRRRPPSRSRRPRRVFEEPDVVVGTVSLSPALYAIYVGEAEQHATTLEREMAAIEADPMHPVSHEFMRAAHTLTSSSRTTGFHVLADVAHALEKWLADAIDYPPEFTADRIATTRRAVDGVVSMVRSIAGRALPLGREDLVEALKALREGLQESRRTGEGTHIRMPAVVREALESQALRAAAPPRRRSRRPSRRSPSSRPRFLRRRSRRPRSRPNPNPSPSRAGPAPAPVAQMPEVAAPVEAAPAPWTSRRAVASEAPGAEPAAPEAEAARPFEAGKDQRKIKDDVDRDLLPIFLEEARELVPAVSEGLRRWKATPTDHSPAADLRRHLHTLKGSARMTGLMRLGELAHVLETRVIDMAEHATPPEREFEEAEDRIDRFSVALERLSRGEDLQDLIPIEVPVSAVFEQQKDKPTPLAVIAAAAEAMAQQQGLPPELREVRAALLRVNADLVDQFVNEAGELSIARSRIEGEMAAFKRALLGSRRERLAHAHAAARDRDRLRRPDAEPPEGAGGARRLLRPARVRPLHAHAGAHALPRRVAGRRDHAAAGPAEEHRRDGARDPPAGAPQPRAAAGPHGGAAGAPGEPGGPLLPRGAPDREGTRQEGQPGAQGHPRRAGPVGAREDHGALRAPPAERGGARDRDARGARGLGEARDRRDLDRRRAARQRGRAHHRGRRQGPGLRAHPRARHRARHARRPATSRRRRRSRSSSSGPDSRRRPRSRRSPAAASAWTW